MKYTRNQLSKTFGISMESLRYLEKRGVLQVEKNPHNNYLEYQDSQIPVIYAIKVFQSAGLPLEKAIELAGDKTPDHSEFIRSGIKELTEQINQIQSKMDYLKFIGDIYEREIEKRNQLIVRHDDSMAYVRFDCKEEEIIAECMRALPYLALLLFVDDPYAENMKPHLGLNVPFMPESCSKIIELAKEKDCLEFTKTGTYLYKVLFVENPLDITKADYQDFIDYAEKHNYTLSNGLFGVVMGPETVEGKKGFYLRLFGYIE